jgi:hypothetical protein
MKISRFSVLVHISIFLVSCTSSKNINTTAVASISGLKFIDEYIIPHNLQFKGTTVGGLSGIDYDRTKDMYYIICDDRSERNPARFYTAKIMISDKGIDSVQFTDAVTLLNTDGKSYPSFRDIPSQAPDPESIRYNPVKNELAWSSEGERINNDQRKVLEDPAIYIMDLNGQRRDSFQLPANMHMHLAEKGPRRNGVFEGITYSDDYRYLFVSVEEPIYEDGSRAGSGDSTAWVRFIKFNTKNKKPVAQYAYQIDPLPSVPNPPEGFRVNGISEIMYVGNDQFIVLERAFVAGRTSNGVRLYLADARYAQNISSVNAIDPPAEAGQDVPSIKPITKKLLLNMDDLGRFIDNVEGITFGPVLSNGNRSLVLVADNNFDDKEKTQIFLFEVLPQQE